MWCRLVALVSHLRFAALRGRVDDEARRELEAHLELLTERYIRQGMTPADARDTARRQFGNVLLIREEIYRMNSIGWLEELATDARHGLRLLTRNRGFTVVATLTIAIGIGANAAIFSTFEAILLRTLPVERPQELVFLHGAADRRAPPYPYFERLRAETPASAGMAAFATDELKVEVDGVVEQVFGQVASGNYFELLGLTPAAGRLMRSDDEKLDPPVAVIGYAYWQRRFGGAADAIGRTLSFGNQIYTIVGVAPASFRGLEPGRHVDVTLPITQERRMLTNAEAQWFYAVARLRPGVTVEQAAAQAVAAFQSILQDRGGSAERWRSRFGGLELSPASRGLDQLRSRFSRPLQALTLAAAVLLLVACVNLAGLLHVRGAARSHEFAVRVATGAGSRRLIRQVLTETLLLFLLGGAGGLVIAHFAIEALTQFFATGRRPIFLDVQYNWAVIAYAAAITLAAGVLTGLWPAMRALRIAPHAVMTGTGRLGGIGRSVTGRLLLVGQLALSFVLLVVALLFARTIANLHGVELGFHGRGVLTMSLQPDHPRDAPPAARERVWAGILERVRRVPGVRAASLSVLTPLSGRNTGVLVGAPGLAPLGEVRLNHVAEDYFRAFGIDVLAGRTISRNDAAGAPRVVVLNETAADQLASAYFSGRSPIGETIVLGDAGSYQVVGIVRDHKHLSVREPAPPYAFVSVWQPIDPLARLTLAVSSDQPAVTLTRAIADDVRAIHANTLLSDIAGIEEQIETTMLAERLLANLATTFGGVVLILAAIGLFGTVSYSVASRRIEFAVQIALGAGRSRVATGVVREVLMPVAGGIVLGLPLALVTGRLAERLLFGVAPADPGSYLLGAVVLVGVACAAAWMPARRACSIEPAQTLRTA